MKTIKLLYFAVATGILILSAGCQKEELQSYTGGDSVSFWIHSKNQSLYGLNEHELPFDTIVLDIAVSGRVKEYDRKVSGTAVEDPASTSADRRKTTAVAGQYTILGGLIPAGSIYGKFKVEIKNVASLQDEELKLRLSLTENEHFDLGLLENSIIDLSWSRKVLKPATWKDMSLFICADYSTMVYKTFILATGLKELNYSTNEVPQAEARVLGRKFGDMVRQYEIDHGTPMLHDDGEKKNLPIVPIY